MIRRFDHHTVRWVDLESPSAEEIEALSEEFSIGPDLLYELVTPTEKPRVDIYPTLVYAVFHFPVVRGRRGRDETKEIDVILGKDYLITAHYGPVEAIDDFARAFELAELLKRGAEISSGYLLLELTGRLYRESEGELDVLEAAIGAIEQEIFEGRERRMVMTISKTGRELILVKRILGNHTETLEALETASVNLFGDSMRNYFHGVAALHYRSYNRAVAMSDIIVELRETNLALLSTRQNEIMKNLTIMAFVMLPLTLAANLFSMNTASTPILGTANDFWIIVGSMAALMVVFFGYFKLKKWF